MTDPSGRDMTAAVAVSVLLVAAGLAADVWLLRRRWAPITSVLRHPVGRAAVWLLLAHRDRLLGRVDPFAAVAVVAARRTAPHQTKSAKYGGFGPICDP